MQQKLRLLTRKVLLLGQHIEAYRNLRETRLAARDLKVQMETWRGLESEPPNSISLVDELRDALHAEKRAITLDGVRQEQEEGREALKEAEQLLRQIGEGA